MSTSNHWRSHSVLVLAALSLGALLSGSCRDSARASGTAIYINVTFNPAGSLTQLRFSAKWKSQSLFDPMLKPGTDGGYEPVAKLTSGQTLRILLPDSLAGELVSVGAEGMFQGRVVSQASSDVRVKKGYEIEVDLQLSSNTEPACGACIGCCAGAVCVSTYSPLNCGSDLLCTRCDPSTADNCATGECRCGSGPACGKTADGCLQGECRCGAGPACGPGQECVNGQCTCTPTKPDAPGSCLNGCCSGSSCLPKAAQTASNCGAASLTCDQCNASQTCNSGVCSDCPATCPDGCCSGETCKPLGLSSCGKGGSACVACDPISADSCNEQGLCACGAGPACGPGQHCADGTCKCDAASCPNGCCRNELCETASADAGVPASLRLCGKNGRACTSCDPARSDTCTSSGQCACGVNPACDLGQKCVNGVCVCDSATCAGCCSPDGLSCKIPGTSDTECGKGGFNCQKCEAPTTCSEGRCSSCTSATCAGCCSGSACLTPLIGQCPADGSLCPCGRDGALCSSCPTLITDTCNADGNCGCGRNPACSAGQHCVNGQCLCDSKSCPSGCCSGTTCVQPSVQQCGSNGSSCFACSTTLANNCSSTGDCRCGSGPSCPAGQRCTDRGCECDCPNGCCSGNLCVSPPTLGNCGAGGSFCVPCDPVRADRCRADGVCACGNGAICAQGQECVAGACKCTAKSCASGCCTAGNTCVTPVTPTNCGLNGVRCVDCTPKGDTCNANGQCRCGTKAPCTQPGETCLRGFCI